MGANLWKPGSYAIATLGVECVTGYTYKGLGMRMSMAGSPKGRRPPTWSLTHLNSGHKVVSLNLPTSRAFEVATQVADLGDWDFETLGGWKNRAPQLRDKVAARTTMRTPRARSQSHARSADLF